MLLLNKMQEIPRRAANIGEMDRTIRRRGPSGHLRDELVGLLRITAAIFVEVG